MLQLIPGNRRLREVISSQQVATVVEQADLGEVRNCNQLAFHCVILDQRGKHVLQSVCHRLQVFGVVGKYPRPDNIDGIYIGVRGAICEVAKIACQNRSRIVAGPDGLDCNTGEFTKLRHESLVPWLVQRVLREDHLDRGAS